MQTVLVLEPFVSFKNSPAPVSRAFGDSNWVLAQEQKAIFSEENRELKKKVRGGSGCVTFCFPLSCFGRRSLVRSAFAAMGRTEISLPSRLASLHAFLPPLAFLLFFFSCCSSLLRPTRRLFPLGVQWLFPSYHGASSRERAVVMKLLRYPGPQWNRCSAETIKYFSLNGRIGLEVVCRDFYSTFVLFIFLWRIRLESNFCSFMFPSYGLWETEVIFLLRCGSFC